MLLTFFSRYFKMITKRVLYGLRLGVPKKRC